MIIIISWYDLSLLFSILLVDDSSISEEDHNIDLKFILNFNYDLSADAKNSLKYSVSLNGISKFRRVKQTVNKTEHIKLLNDVSQILAFSCRLSLH